MRLSKRQEAEKREAEFKIESLYPIEVKSIWSEFKNQHGAFLFFLVYFFFEYIRPQNLYPVIDILPWAQVSLGLAVLLVFSDKTVTAVKHPLNSLFIIFLLITIVSSLISVYPEESWKYRNIWLSWILVYYLTINMVNTEKKFFLFIIAYQLFNFKMAGGGAFVWASRGFSFAGYGLIGSPGWFHNSGEFAIQMIIFGSIAVAFVMSLSQHWSKVKKWIFYIAASTGYLSVIGASSRGAQLGLLTVFIVFALKSKNGFKGLIGVAILGGLLYTVLPDEQMSRFKDIGDDRSSQQRLNYWKVGVDIIKDNPVLGIGYKNWVPVVRELYPEGIPPLNVVQVPHSIYIEAAAEYGTLGLLIFLLMVFVAFRTNIKTRRNLELNKDRLLYNISFALDAGIIGFLIAGAFVTVLTYPFFWIQIAMIVALNNVSKKVQLRLKELKLNEKEC